MAAAVGYMAAHVPLDVGAEVALAAVFRGNKRVCEACDEGVLRACVRAVERTLEGRFLAPLHELVVCGGMPIKRNQIAVLRALLAAAPRCVRACVDGSAAAERAAPIAEHEASGEREPAGALACVRAGAGTHMRVLHDCPVDTRMRNPCVDFLCRPAIRRILFLYVRPFDSLFDFLNN